MTDHSGNESNSDLSRLVAVGLQLKESLKDFSHANNKVDRTTLLLEHEPYIAVALGAQLISYMTRGEQIELLKRCIEQAIVCQDGYFENIIQFIHLFNPVFVKQNVEALAQPYLDGEHYWGRALSIFHSTSEHLAEKYSRLALENTDPDIRSRGESSIDHFELIYQPSHKNK